MAHLKEDVHLEELKNHVPSPLADKIITVPHSSELRQINLNILSKVISIENKAGIERIKINNSKIGSQEFENFLVSTKRQAESNGEREQTIACKYLLELHALINRIDDFTIEICVEKAKDFLFSNNVDEPTEIEIFCKDEYMDLIDTMENLIGSIGENEKLERLVEAIIKNTKNEKDRGLNLIKRFICKE